MSQFAFAGQPGSLWGLGEEKTQATEDTWTGIPRCAHIGTVCSRQNVEKRSGLQKISVTMLKIENSVMRRRRVLGKALGYQEKDESCSLVLTSIHHMYSSSLRLVACRLVPQHTRAVFQAHESPCIYK